LLTQELQYLFKYIKNNHKNLPSNDIFHEMIDLNQRNASFCRLCQSILAILDLNTNEAVIIFYLDIDSNHLNDLSDSATSDVVSQELFAFLSNDIQKESHNQEISESIFNDFQKERPVYYLSKSNEISHQFNRRFSQSND
jgi:hypothetical protein